MVVIVGMCVVLVPCNEFVWPGRAVNTAITFYFNPFVDAVGAGHDYAGPGGGLKRNRIVRLAALFDYNSLTVDAAMNNHRIARLGERRGLGDCSHLFLLLDASQRFS